MNTKTYSIRNSDIYNLLFRVGMIWRVIYGFLRLGLGLVLLRVIGTPFSDLFYKIMSHEFVEDPNDLFLRGAEYIIQHQSFTVTYFLVVYLMFWGVIDVILSFSLLKQKLWAFPISMYLIGIFILYEIYRFSYIHSFTLVGIIFIDLVLIWLINKEYRKQLKTSGKL